METLVSAVLLGFVLGLQHATDPDHLVAVATIVTREDRFTSGALVGLLWGAGHTVTLVAAGTVLVAFDLGMPAQAARALELLAAVMLVILGVVRLREALRGIVAVPRERRVADHHHEGSAMVHAHHGVAHVHPPARLLAAWRDERGRVGRRAMTVGAVHGMAGTAAVALLVLTTLRTPLAAGVYLLVFGLGTLAGMTALTAAMVYPASRWVRLRRVGDAMGIASGGGAIAFGCWYAAHLL